MSEDKKSEEPKWFPVPPAVLSKMRSVNAGDLVELLGHKFGEWGGNKSSTNLGKRSRNPKALISTSKPDPSRPTFSVDISRTRKGVISSAEFSPDPGTDRKKAVSDFEVFVDESIKTLQETPTPHVATRIVFSYKPVSGEFCLPPIFALRQPPASAPLPGASFGDYPAMLTFSYDSISNQWIKMRREQQALDDLLLTLNVFIRTGLWCMKKSDHKWVFDGKSGPPESRYLQEGYHTAFKAEDYKLEPSGLTAIPLVSDSDYYSAFGISILDGFQLPKTLSERVRGTLALDQESREAFLAAARHFAISKNCRGISESYWNIGLVSAIEVLAATWSSHWSDTDKCDECDQMIFSIFKRFRAFLRTYGDSSKSANKLYRAYYGARSKILHAGEFLMSERAGAWHEDSGEELGRLIGLENTVRVSIINWLQDPFKNPGASSGL